MKTENFSRFYQAFGHYLIWTILIVGSMVIYLYQHVVVTDLAGELGALKEEQKKLLDERERLMLNASRLTHGKRVATMAAEKLSMTLPSGSPKNVFLSSH